MGLHLLSPSPSTVVDINLFGFSEKWLEGLLRITSAILGGVSKELEICDKYGLSKFTATSHVGTEYSKTSNSRS